MPPRRWTTKTLWKVCALLMLGPWPRRLTAALAALGTLAALGACSLGQTSTANNLPPGSGTVYVAAGPLVQALASGNGKPRWEDRLTSNSSGMASNGTTLFVGNPLPHQPGQPSRGTLTALRADTGAELWARDYADGAPIPAGATTDIVFALADSSLEALSTADGSVLWRTEKSRWSVLAVDDGRLYVTSAVQVMPFTIPQVTLVALGDSDGQPLWRYALPRPPATSPIFSDGVLYVAEEPIGLSNTVLNMILAVRASDGTLLWQTRTPADEPVEVSTGTISLLAGAGHVYYLYFDGSKWGYTDLSKGIVALDATDGTIAWRHPESFLYLELLTVYDGKLYFENVVRKNPEDAGIDTLHAYDAQSATAVFERKLPINPQDYHPRDAPKSQLWGLGYLLPVGVTDGALILSGESFVLPFVSSQRDQAGLVFALDVRDGKLLWANPLGYKDHPVSILLAP
jgi:outer membrane protein assembly factor BamB